MNHRFYSLNACDLLMYKIVHLMHTLSRFFREGASHVHRYRPQLLMIVYDMQYIEEYRGISASIERIKRFSRTVYTDKYYKNN